MYLLYAANHNVDDIRRYITADTLNYIDSTTLTEVVNCEPSFCDACFTGKYPVTFPGIEGLQTRQLTLF